jgi:hypothetical protein
MTLINNTPLLSTSASLFLLRGFILRATSLTTGEHEEYIQTNGPVIYQVQGEFKSIIHLY